MGDRRRNARINKVTTNNVTELARKQSLRRNSMVGREDWILLLEC